MRRRRIRTSSLLWSCLLATLALALPTAAHAQLRIVTYNTLDGPTSAGEFPDWNVVLDAIGDQSVNGVAQRIGIMALQEVSTSGASAQNIANLLNGLYGVTSYQAATAPFGDGFNLQSLVYDTSQVQLLSTSAPDIGTRPAWRGRFRPVGYAGNTAAEFYVYSSHLKAFPEFEATRASEAQALRNNGNSLGASANLIYAGDYNLTGGANEQAYAIMLAPGNGQAIDPEGGNFTNIKKTYSSSSPVSRLDFQFVSTELEDDEGLDLIDGSYRVFGRVFAPGSSTIITTPTQLTDTSDHLPVVADYQLPAVLSAVAGTVPATLNVGQVFNLDVTVSNAANVLQPIGADELDYSLTTAGNLFGSVFNQVDLALGGVNIHQVQLDTSTPGMKSGTISVQSGSQAVQNALIQIPISYEVVAATLAGDYNDDGTVDAADYVIWRDGFGTLYTQDDYIVWKNNFGQSLGGGVAAVPEPGAVLLLVAGACWLAVRPATLRAWNGRT